MGDGQDAREWHSMLYSIARLRAQGGGPVEAVESQPAADRNLRRGRKDETADSGQDKGPKARRERVSKRDVVLAVGRIRRIKTRLRLVGG